MTVLGISSSSAIAAGTDHLKIKSAEAEWEGLEKSVGLEVETNVAIPMEGKSGAFGFGALTDGTNNVLVLTTHLPIDDSSHEHATSGFQTHVLDLERPALHVLVRISRLTWRDLLKTRHSTPTMSGPSRATRSKWKKYPHAIWVIRAWKVW
jgi:hypothetical protein